MNELSTETSPYLLQHAQNPVHWKAWNEHALKLAIDQNKLLIVSIGYSACHWCHVMEHETFEDEEAANTMNAHFVSIKIDREERPDIDAVYMKAVQIMTGRGGWPLNVVCLPDGRPVWGGTYFRKSEWIETLEQLHKLYESNPEKITEYAEQLHAGIESISLIQNENSTSDMPQDIILPLIEKWKKSFDWDFGGMARAPKFMMPNNYEFLMRYGQQQNDETILDFVDLTLTKMAYGGLFDTVDGAFSRYSVDLKWHVPHFEKMLYDNGQLVSLYSNAYKRTRNPLYKEVVEKTLAFVSREWMTSEGAFCCALDADSLNTEGKLEEGAFYVWTKSELQQLLSNDYELFAIVFNINSFGYWENDHYVLIQNESLETIAKNNELTLAALQLKKKTWEKILFDARENRSKPRLDDKCLTSWNAIMLKGFTEAHKAFKTPDYLRIALANANFIISKQWSSEGHLWHSFTAGKSSINGYLEDYAQVIDAFLALYEVTFDEQWLQHSKQLTNYCFDHFFVAEGGFFSFTSNLDAALIAPHFETEDNVVPASNSVMAQNLYKLGLYFDNSHYRDVVGRMLRHIIPQIDYPAAFSNWLNVFLNGSEKSRELAICGTDALQYASNINSFYFPDLTLAGTEKPSVIPFLQNRFSTNKTLFYVCEQQTCSAPTENFSEVNQLLST